jgi:predicted nucleotidyltransferase component of viral defense system
LAASIGEVKALDLAAFNPIAAQKVRWLLLILERINTHPFLGPKVCLHGGTAINLFFLDVPRLSVDIDLNYIGSVKRDVMLEERPKIEQTLEDIARQLNLKITKSEQEHSGRSFKLLYPTGTGSDFVKIDMDYLNRSPLLPPVLGRVKLDGEITEFPINTAIELIGGKTKALLDRVVPRDFFDICQISDIFPSLIKQDDEKLYRRILLYFCVVAAPFPRPFEVVNRFEGRERDVEEILYPMLAGNERPALADMIAKAKVFIDDISAPKDDDEQAFMDKAAKGEFEPDLLFGDYPNVLKAALCDPTMLWKMQNLRKTTLSVRWEPNPVI